MTWLFRVGVFLGVIMFSPSVWCVSVTVDIEGLTPTLRDHVLSYLDISREQGNSKLALTRLQRLHRQAPRQIKTALQIYGYYQPHIKSELREDGSDWVATYSIELGEAIRIGSVDLVVSGAGRDNPAIKQAIADFPIAKGQILVDPTYDAARDALFRTMIEQGFLDTTFEKREVKVDLPSYSAIVILHIQTGNRYYFGEVSFSHDSMDEKFLRRFVNLKPGDPYSPGKLLRLQTSLSDSSLFQSVDVQASKSQAIDYRVPIKVTTTARKRTTWRFGIGYATDTGARTSVDYNRIVGDNGHKFQSKILLSETTKSLTTGYKIPLADPVNEQLGFGARYSDELIENRRSDISGLSVNYTSPWKDWIRVISLNYDREVYTINDEPEETGRALYPLISITRVVADNRINTTDGYRLYLELRGANSNLLSDTNYAQFRAGMKLIHGLDEGSRLILRSDLGSTNVATLSSMPLSQRFFAGGDNSVRGYAYQELGPKDSYGNVVGGKYLIVGSVEFEQHIAGKWSGAVFYDVGNAIDNMGEKLDAGTGFGLRWNSPVGPIRLDFAWGLAKETDRFRLHVIIGPDL
jgi:translocation and assembly module TamA